MNANDRGRGKLFRSYLNEKLKDPVFKRGYEAEVKKVRFGYAVHQLRAKAGMTQARLAEKVGVTQGYIAQLEKADTDNYELKTLRKIADAFGVEFFIGFVRKPKPGHSVAPLRNFIRF